MGGTFSVKVVTAKDELESTGFGDLDRAIRSSLTRINLLMSTWDPDSELSRFNRSTSLAPFALSPETFEVFKWSIDIGALTGGALDVTIGPLVDAWGFGPSGPRQTLPTNDEIARLREAMGPGKIELNPATMTVRKTKPDVQCDLSSVVPGYAADRLSRELTDRGFTDFLVDVGGEVLARGRNQAGAPWQVAIERPERHGETIQRLVPISDLAITTAGDYRKYREVDGQPGRAHPGPANRASVDAPAGVRHRHRPARGSRRRVRHSADGTRDRRGHGAGDEAGPRRAVHRTHE